MSILKKLQAQLLRTRNDNFQYCVERYVRKAKKHDFDKNMFLDEFEDDPKLQGLLADVCDELTFSQLKSELCNMSHQIALAKLRSDSTSYKELADLTAFVSFRELEAIMGEYDLTDCKGSKKIRFAYLFKLLEPYFLLPPSGRWSLSDTQRSKLIMKVISLSSQPSRQIIKELSASHGRINKNFDDVWLMKELRSSL